ncbi:MAG TPA: NADH-ubiquinone oxidoreductase-F iron-sulfur binding region domain-containing protein [Gaiellaceae bacterium]|nr:NADH-ubiquinone oxidoreductase-F iron-sulfur binding region domain-containing protein [Gaiellaceae bacterium]
MSSASAAVAPEAGLPRLFAGVRRDGLPLGLGAHAATHGPLPSPRGLIELVTAGGLRGRGGGGFPAGRKLAAVAGARRRPVVVANGAEGEPVSFKDKLLLRRAPHLVLDGAALAAAAVGAREVVVALDRSAGEEIGVVSAALDERRDRGLSWRLAVVPTGFVTGEETALLSALVGRDPKPTFTPPRPFERGLRGAPTLVQNVETLAHVALIARHGPDWFRALGTRQEPGSALFTVFGAVARPGVYEAAFGTPIRALVEQAGGVRGSAGAFLIGGFFGSWVDPAAAQGLSVLDADLARAGAALGAGAVVVLPAAACGLDQSARVARYLAEESAGQCGPCVHGLAALAGALETLASGHGDSRRDALRWLEQVRGRGACRHPDGAARFVESSLEVFAGEVELHLQGRCSGRRGEFIPTGRSR